MRQRNRVQASLRHRPAQAVALLLLATVIVTATTFTPLFTRALEQSVTKLTIHDADAVTSGIQLGWAADPTLPLGVHISVLSPDTMSGDLPDGMVRYFEPAVRSLQASPPSRVHSQSVEGTILARDRQCRHVRMVAGTCPDAAGQIAVSRADHTILHADVGDTYVIANAGDHAHPIHLKVVGIYEQVASKWWFGPSLTGYSGKSGSGPGIVQHDTWLAGYATLDYGELNFPGVHNDLLSQLRPDISVDALPRITALLKKLEKNLLIEDPAGQPDLTTGIPDLVRAIAHQRDQAQVTVPTLMAQLGLLALAVLWLALVTVIDQRRPEVALALLRGRGRKGARRLLHAELLPVFGAAVVLGTICGFAVATAARVFFLPESPPFEITRGFGWAVLLAAVVLGGTCAIAVLRVTREPVERLLRQVAPRPAGWHLGVVPAMGLAGAGVLTIAFLSGGLHGSASTAGPAVLALLSGLLLSIVVPPLAARAARRLLVRGRTRTALGMLDAARSPSTRRSVALVTVATALLVFGLDAAAVGAHNRTLAAQQLVGAPRVLSLAQYDLGPIRKALAEVNAHGVRATAVVMQHSSAAQRPATLAAPVKQFDQVTGSSLPTSALAPATPDPVRVRGGSISARLTTTNAPGSAPVSLAVEVTYPGGTVHTVTIGRISPKLNHTVTVHAPVPCLEGCDLIGLGVASNPGRNPEGGVRVSDLSVGSDPVDPGPVADWAPLDTDRGRVKLTRLSPGNATVDFASRGSETAFATQRWYPSSLPAIIARGRSVDVRPGQHFLAAGVDGVDRQFQAVTTTGRILGAAPGTALVDLDLAERGAQLDAADDVT
ncbi:MAG TPA: FtsX-like permease family protein, partial [Marmoricola sp.]